MITNTPELTPSMDPQPLVEVVYQGEEALIHTKLKEVAQRSLETISELSGITYAIRIKTHSHDRVTCHFGEDGTRTFDVTYHGGFITALGVTSSWSPSES